MEGHEAVVKLFQSDPVRYHSEGVKIRTAAASYLTGGALSWFKAYHDEETQEIRFHTYADFVIAFKAAYDDPDRRATALGFIIKGNETRMKPDKLDIIRDWPRPTTKKQTQVFLGFANYY